MWSGIAQFIDRLPEETKNGAIMILQEGERTSSEIIDFAMDLSSTGFRQLAGAAVLRRQGWLKSTSFRPEVQSKILDIPYETGKLCLESMLMTHSSPLKLIQKQQGP